MNTNKHASDNPSRGHFLLAAWLGAALCLLPGVVMAATNYYVTAGRPGRSRDE